MGGHSGLGAGQHSGFHRGDGASDSRAVTYAQGGQVMMPHLDTLWVYMARSPLLWLTATLLAYRISLFIYERSGRSGLANPVAISVTLLVLLLLITDTPYAVYFDGAQFVHFLLG